MTADGGAPLPVLAREGQVAVAPGDVSHVCPGCNTGHPTGKDDDPRHVVLGAGAETQMAVLENGTRVPIQVPVDMAWHFDCHAFVGCDHCAEMLAAHDNSVKGKASEIQPPDHLLDIEPAEFSFGVGGIMVRQKTKTEAREEREADHLANDVRFIDVESAATLHAQHAAGEI